METVADVAIEKEEQEKPKRNRSPNKVDLLEPEVKELKGRVAALEAMICKLASITGSRHLPLEYDPKSNHLKPWDPVQKDMRKFSN